MPYKIIVADPSVSVQKAAQLAFPEPEFRIFPFDDGAALVDSVEEVRPDAVLLSLNLPGRDPFEIGRLLRGREDFRRVPLLLLRGTFEAPDPSKTAPDHDGMIQKPFDSERLAAVVRDLIERKTEPSTLPEEPIFQAEGDSRPASLPEGPGSPAAAGPEPSRPEGPGPADSLLREWIRKEIHGAEKDVEKRVRARVLADVKEWMAGDGRDKEETS
ncbi:MAG: response regulator [Candidatus Aminicenantales bacterium]